MEQSLRNFRAYRCISFVKMITIGQVFVYDVTDIANASSKIPVTLNFPELNICIIDRCSLSTTSKHNSYPLWLYLRYRCLNA